MSNMMQEVKDADSPSWILKGTRFGRLLDPIGSLESPVSSNTYPSKRTQGIYKNIKHIKTSMHLQSTMFGSCSLKPQPLRCFLLVISWYSTLWVANAPENLRIQLVTNCILAACLHKCRWNYHYSSLELPRHNGYREFAMNRWWI